MSLWDIIQQVQIENLRSRQNVGKWEADHLADRTLARDTALGQRVERMALVAEAMWELLSERAGISQDDLLARVRVIDARDGAVDGRRGIAPDAPVTRCAACQAVVPPGRKDCQFCGTAVPGREVDPFKV